MPTPLSTFSALEPMFVGTCAGRIAKQLAKPKKGPEKMHKGGLRFLPGDDAYCNAWEFGPWLIIGPLEKGGGRFDVSRSSVRSDKSDCYCKRDTGGEWCHCRHSKDVVKDVTRRAALRAVMNAT